MMDRRSIHNSAIFALGLITLLLLAASMRFTIGPLKPKQFQTDPTFLVTSEINTEELIELSPARFPVQVVATSLRFEGPPLPSRVKTSSSARFEDAQDAHLPPHIEPKYDALPTRHLVHTHSLETNTESLPAIEYDELENSSMERLPLVEDSAKEELQPYSLQAGEQTTIERLPEVSEEADAIHDDLPPTSSTREVVGNEFDFDLFDPGAPAVNEPIETAISKDDEDERSLLTPLPQVENLESNAPVALEDIPVSLSEKATPLTILSQKPAVSSDFIGNQTAEKGTEKPLNLHQISRRNYGPNPAMAAVEQRANELSQHGFSLAQRGAFYSARAELIQALRLIAQSLDAGSGGQSHSRHLAMGLQALEEADDFSPQGSQLEADIDMSAVIASHRTPALKEMNIATVSPLSALQSYYTFAQQELALAAGREKAASHALYGLGKIHITLAEKSLAAPNMNGPKAMALYQAALTADANNYLAANELGVLLAKYGQLQDARTVMLHCVTLRPTAEAWHNLSIIHQRLGEVDLAKRSRTEWKLALQNSGRFASSTVRTAGMVRWTSPADFSATGARPKAAPSVTHQPPQTTPQDKAAWWNPMHLFKR